MCGDFISFPFILFILCEWWRYDLFFLSIYVILNALVCWLVWLLARRKDSDIRYPSNSFPFGVF